MAQDKNLLAFETESLPGFKVGVFQQFNLQVSGGTPPYTFAITQGNLPNNLSLSMGGEITGAVMAEVADSTIFVQVTDIQGNHETQAFDVQTRKG